MPRSRAGSRRFAALAFAIALPSLANGCLSADLEGSRFYCAEDDSCPDGFECCSDGYCAESCEGVVGSCVDPGDPCCTAAGARYAGCWPDATSGLSWEDPPSDQYFTYDDAVTRCPGLELGGHSDWRLPNVTELRTLIRGCASTESGGACPAAHPGCLESTVTGCNPDACLGCNYAPDQGPGRDGCYWDVALSGACEYSHWSSSIETIFPTEYAWVVFFDMALVSVMERITELNVRCVRGP